MIETYYLEEFIDLIHLLHHLNLSKSFDDDRLVHLTSILTSWQLHIGLQWRAQQPTFFNP
jgi:hypothetical protein